MMMMMMIIIIIIIFIIITITASATRFRLPCPLQQSGSGSGYAPQGSPHFLIGIYCGLAGCDFLASALLFITGGVPLPCDSVNLAFLAKAACGRLAFYSTALKL